MQLIRFKEDYFLYKGDKKSGDMFKPKEKQSYARLFETGEVYRFGELLGTVNEIKFPVATDKSQ